MSHADILKQARDFTSSHPGIAVKIVSANEHSTVFVNGKEKLEHGPSGMMPIIEPEPGAHSLDAEAFLPSTFYTGTWDESTALFTPDGGPISLEQFIELSKS